MVLGEVDACALPEIPSFTCLMILQSQEKIQKAANDFSNLEQLDYISIGYFARNTRFHRASLVSLCRGRLIAGQSTLQGRKRIVLIIITIIIIVIIIIIIVIVIILTVIVKDIDFISTIKTTSKYLQF